MYKILIIDDEAVVRNSISRNIKWDEFGFELSDACEDGKKAIEAIDKYKPDVVITDICMPFLDGIELTRYISSKYPNTKVIILTGFDEFEYAQQAIKLDVFDFILKPITPNELKKVLNKLRTKLDEENNNTESLNRLKEQLRESLPLLKERFLNRVALGYIKNEKVEEKLKYFDINLKGHYYLAIALDLDDYRESGMFKHGDDDELLYFAICNICEEIISREYIGEVFQNNRNCIIIFLSDDDDCLLQESATRLSEEIRSAIEKYLKFTITVGIGTICSDLKSLYLSYKSAASALDYRFVLGRNQVININDLENTRNNRSEFNNELKKKLITEIKIGTTQNIDQVINILFQDIRASYSSLEGSYLQIQQIIVLILSALNDMGYDEAELFGTGFSPLTGVYQFKTLDQIEGWIKELCQKIALFVFNKRNNLSELQALKAEEYIKSNYHNENISLNSVCKHLLLSTSYFSMIFKNHTGVTFIEYLTRIRVEKAMELLKVTNLKAYEIANQVGYSDSHYFSSIFKKATGLTSTEYREKILGINI
jgi:two-component system, response regulator YesN